MRSLLQFLKADVELTPAMLPLAPVRAHWDGVKHGAAVFLHQSPMASRVTAPTARPLPAARELGQFAQVNVRLVQRLRAGRCPQRTRAGAGEPPP